MTAPKYPHVKVNLNIHPDFQPTGFMILANVVGALKKANVPPEEVAKFQQEATSGNYSHLLSTIHKWVTVS